MNSILKVLSVLIWLDMVVSEVYYAAEFADDIVPCPDFDNKLYKADNLKVGMVPGEEEDDDDDGGLGLSGFIELKQELEDGKEICIKVSKVLEVGKELMYNVRGDICSSLQKEDAPWFPLVQSLNRSECPIPVDVYSIADMKMSLDFAKDVLNHEFCGEYEVELSIVDGATELACYIVGIVINEKDTDDD